MISNTIKKTDGKKLLLQGLIIFFIFFGVSLLSKGLPFSKDSSAFLPNLLNFIFSISLAACCYRFIKSDKIFVEKLQFSRVSKILFAVLLGIFIVLFLIVFRVPYNIQTVLRKGIVPALSILLAAAAAGVFEEFLVRGVFFAGFLQVFQNKNRMRSVFWASCASAVLFGLLHLTNLTSSSFTAVIQQVFYAAAFGLIFAALRIKYNNLWIPTIIHTLIDFQPAVASNGAPSGHSWIGLIVIFLPLAFLGLTVLFHFDRDCNRSEKAAEMKTVQNT
ncbi:CPBP family intramembrane glutamic endopeptidase [Streptococcus chenjunshii]|nr:CPBP family intramembrane glutamic endopeptidase [Streptococcus chenjunshii]